MSMFEDVQAFHEKFDLPHTEASIIPRLMSPADYKWRVAFMQEELREFIEAHTNRDIVECADALADLIWVALGTAHYMGIPLDAVWAEVRRSNLEKRPWKEGDPIKPRNQALNVTGEIVKPLGWRPPNVRDAVFGEDL